MDFVQILLNVNLSLNILALCETNMDDSIDSCNFSVTGYLPLFWKDSITHMHGPAVYVKEGLPFSWDLSLKNSTDSFLCFWLALLHSVSYFFFLYQSPSSLGLVFDSISSNLDEVLLINPSANVFVFGDFNFHHQGFQKWWGVAVGGIFSPGGENLRRSDFDQSIFYKAKNSFLWILNINMSKNAVFIGL